VMGCAKPERLEPYVVVMPAGVPGQRQWKELWIVSGCNSKFPVHIEFTESGPGAADWTIRKWALTTRSTWMPTGGASRLGGRRLPWFF